MGATQVVYTASVDTSEDVAQVSPASMTVVAAIVAVASVGAEVVADVASAKETNIGP